MSIDRRLLAIIGRRFPAIYDVRFPRGPLSVAGQSRLSEVALNPQPLPPHEIGAAVASEFIRLAWLSEKFGQDPGLALSELDDWCPTVPKRPRFPTWWPPIPEPDPEPDWFVDFHLGFATRLAVASGEVESSRLSESIDRALERSVSSIEMAIG
jgi:hypothetical protein